MGVSAMRCPRRQELVDLIVVCEQEAPLTLLRHEVVAANGGEVVLVDILPGHSTTSLVKRAREHRA